MRQDCLQHGRDCHLPANAVVQPPGTVVVDEAVPHPQAYATTAWVNAGPLTVLQTP